MKPDPLRMLEAPHITRNEETGEVTWPPSSIELELIHLGLIEGAFKHEQPVRNKRNVGRHRLRDEA